MQRALVTGGAGFIGSTLVRKLADEPGVEVSIIDNLSSGKRSNIEEVASRVPLYEADIRDYASILPLLQGVDTVFHLAAIPSVPRSISDPVPSHECNIDGTFQVLRACVEAGVRRVVYAGSSSAYGDSETLPKTESMLPRPKSPYAMQKLAGEYYCSVYHACWGLETFALRFFNVYGPRQDPSSPYSGVISIFLKCVLARSAPVIYGDGEQSRDFTFVEDVAGLCLKAARAPARLAGKVYNAGNGNRYTLNEVWRLLCRMEGVHIDPVYGAPRPGDVRHSQADTTAAVRDLGHSPRFSLEEGLRRTLDWFRRELR